MKTTTRIFALAVAGVAALSLTTLPMAVADDGRLNDAEVANLVFSREEERLARDLYQAFADQYAGARPFSKIAEAEQRHFDAVGNLLIAYDIADPSDGAAAGSYSDATLQGLYDQWYAQGMQSLPDAYQVGIDLEKRDIADLEAGLSTTQTAEVRTVLENLLNGSENHLAAYERAASGRGGEGQGMKSRQGGNVQQRHQRCDGSCDGTGPDARHGVGNAAAEGTGPRAGHGACRHA